MSADRIKPPPRVPVAHLDKQHRNIHRTLMSLIHTLELQPTGSHTQDRFLKLDAEVQEHFQTEEAFLAEQGYPDLDLHRQEHQMLVGQFREMLQRWNAPGAPPLVDLVREVARMTGRHIDHVDMDYVKWLGTRTGGG